MLPLCAAASTTWLLVNINPSLSKKNPDPVPELPDPFTAIETTAGMTLAARPAMESGALSIELVVCTKLALKLVAPPRPKNAPTPPAIKAMITAKI